MPKKRKRKLIIKRLTLVTIGLFLIIYGAFKLFTHDIKNIYIKNNYILSDLEIKSLIDLDIGKNYFNKTTNKIIILIEKNKYIKEAKVKKKLFGKIYIEITEYKALFYRYNNNYLILEDNHEIKNPKLEILAPIIINYVNEEHFNSFIKEYQKLDQKIINRISQIEYQPNEVDKERFLFYMNDGNIVYINILKLNNLNKYDEILPTLEGEKGILYLDLGNYFEPF